MICCGTSVPFGDFNCNPWNKNGTKEGICVMEAYEKETYARAQITAALLQLMETRDYQTIRISDLACAAQVSRSSFYRNFADKDDVLQQYLKKLMEEWRQAFEAEPGQEFSDSLLRHFYEKRDFYLLLYRSGLSWMLHEAIKSACGWKADMPPILAYGTASVAGALFGWVDAWISRGMRETPEELKRLAVQVEQ